MRVPKTRSRWAQWPLMTPGQRRLALTAHVSLSVGWLGAVISFLALAIAGAASEQPQTVRAAHLAMGLLVSYVIVPLAVSGLLTGLVSALWSKWGLFQHYWVLLKLLLTVVAIVILLAQLEPIAQLAEVARDPASSIAILRGNKRPLLHAAGGLVVLLVVQVLGLYKPRGMTRHGWRQRREQPAGDRHPT